MGDLGGFGSTAHKLSRGPLGIIALLIVLVYAMAALVAGISSLETQAERLPLIYFLLAFPVLVLVTLAWLLAKHPASLYPPTDFKDEGNYIKALQLARASASLVAADLMSPGAKPAEEAINEAIAAVEGAVPSIANRQCVLWVDDRPENNRLLRDAFREFGIDVQIALSTEQALDALGHQTFSTIISDMGRKEGPQEGYVLLNEVRNKGLTTPFFIYAGSNLEEHRREAIRRGAQGSTNDASELFREVTKAVLGAPSNRG